MIRSLSARCGAMAEEEIARLENMARELPLFAEIMEADLFIDCPVSEDRAIVIAQAGPNAYSIYHKSVVGEDALKCNEPAIFQAIRQNTPVRNIKAVTQENRTVSQSVVPIHGIGGRVIAVLIQETDISQDIRREKKLEAFSRSFEKGDPSLRSERVEDADVLALREVHHRVKNSLQLVASILNLQARKLRGTESAKILAENVSRILTIAAIHDMLTVKEDGAETVYALPMLRQLASQLGSFVPEEKRIAIEVSGDNAVIGSNQASAAALVVNELVINALEHAFAGRDQGRIEITFTSGEYFHMIAVSDDGSGFRADQKAEEGLGLRIAESTVRGKLKGKLHIHSDESGTVVSFDIKKEIV